MVRCKPKHGSMVFIHTCRREHIWSMAGQQECEGGVVMVPIHGDTMEYMGNMARPVGILSPLPRVCGSLSE